MRKYLRSRPQHEKEVISDLYAFDSPSDYLAYEGSEFATPQEYLSAEKIKQEALERDRLLAEHLEQERYKRDCLEHKRIRRERMLLQYKEFFSLNIFSDLDEFFQFVEDFYDRDWSSNHPSRISVDSDKYRCAIQKLALNKLQKQPRPVVKSPYRPSPSFEREFTANYLNGDIGNEPNEALDAHIAEKSLHADRRTRNVRATNRHVRFAHEGIESSFVLPSTNPNPREHHTVGIPGFICKRYQEAKRKFAEYNHVVSNCSGDQNAVRVFGNATLSPLNRKRYAETIRRSKSSIRLAKHYGSFSTEERRYLKKETAHVSSSSVIEKPENNKKIPKNLLDYVNYRFGVTRKKSKCSLQKKLFETITPVLEVPFSPCHIVPSFAKH